MAVTIVGEHRLDAPRYKIWEMLNDPEVLRACIPGCETLIKTSDTNFEALVTAKIGPVRAKFSGRVELTDVDPPNGYKLVGEGVGGIAGFAKGGAKVILTDTADGTLLSYSVDAQVGGKLAQLGQRLINGLATKLAAEFFGAFARLASPPSNHEQ